MFFNPGDKRLCSIVGSPYELLRCCLIWSIRGMHMSPLQIARGTPSTGPQPHSFRLTNKRLIKVQLFTLPMDKLLIQDLGILTESLTVNN